MGCDAGRTAGGGRRPFCFECSKPLRLCLCSRFRSPPLDNAVSLTILQHALEKDHPVNSTRVAKLGLKNLTVAPVTDVNFRSCFFIRPLGVVEKSNFEGLSFHNNEAGNIGNSECGKGNGVDYMDGSENAIDCGVCKNDLSFDCGKGHGFRNNEGVNSSGHDSSSNFECGEGNGVYDMGGLQNAGDCCVCKNGSSSGCGKRRGFCKNEAAYISNCNYTSNLECAKGHSVHDMNESENASNCDSDSKFDCVKGRIVDDKNELGIVSKCDSVISFRCVKGHGVLENVMNYDCLSSENVQGSLSPCWDEMALSFSSRLKTTGFEGFNNCGVDVDGRMIEEKGKYGCDYLSNGNVQGSLLDNCEEMALLSLSEPKGMGYSCSKECGIDLADRISDEKKYNVAYTRDGGFKVFFEHHAKPDIKWLKDTVIGKRLILDGFFVKKLQRKQVRVTKEFEDFEEFDIQVPPGTALLFPSDDAVSLKDVDFEVKHLIVLDGTWSKAKRMYHENPWLQLLPHLKLDTGKVSLYSGVRTQPKEGYLSTIESIVCAMEALGEDNERLGELLDVFYSMIVDQKQCKADKFRAMSVK